MARNLFSATGSSLDVVGTLELPITIKGLQFPQNAMVVSNLNQNLILGENFMRNYQVILNYQDNSVSIEDGLVCVPMYNNARKTSYVRLVKPFCVMPYSIATLPVSLSRKFVHKDCIIESIPGQQFDRFAVQRSIVRPTCNKSVCRILNFKDVPLVLRRNQNIAVVDRVENVGILAAQSNSSAPAAAEATVRAASAAKCSSKQTAAATKRVNSIAQSSACGSSDCLAAAAATALPAACSKQTVQQ